MVGHLLNFVEDDATTGVEVQITNSDYLYLSDDYLSVYLFTYFYVVFLHCTVSGQTLENRRSLLYSAVH